ncbi:hypothetical protein PVL29_009100 [Vitis rotundifolia]|uniref:1-phosphatidylinositol 4-kinase n=1 Tax=Vitis rotundifolia TaxID=103349 RepID=A0AA39DX35_VITRO|nr:hypothetical protein PVL29_009100 [Vitis rotundifolia]
MVNFEAKTTIPSHLLKRNIHVHNDKQTKQSIIKGLCLPSLEMYPCLDAPGKTLGQPSLKRSVRVREKSFKEVAAYLLDYNHFANVPSTALVKITHSIFNANDRQFIPHDFDVGDHGTSSFTVSTVHRIGTLEIRISKHRNLSSQLLE